MTASGNKLPSKRVKYDKISYIADEIIKYYEHFIHVSLDEIWYNDYVFTDIFS